MMAVPGIRMNIVLIPNKRGSTLLGIATPLGILPITTFSSLEEVRNFAMGILGYAEYFSPKVPEAYLRAFKEDDDV